MTCSLFELVTELTFDHLGIVTNTCLLDTIPNKQQQQGLMCFTSWCHWESYSPSKVCGIHLCTSVAPSGHCTGEHHVWEYRITQSMITKIMNIHSELSWQQGVEHSPNPFLCCRLDSLLGLLRGNDTLFGQDYQIYWQISYHTDQRYADLNLGLKYSCKVVIIHYISDIIS